MIRPRGAPLDPARVARHYDALDRYYRELWGEHVHHGLWQTGRESPREAVEALVHRVAAEAHLVPGTRVCDVGCGYGATGRLLAREYGAEVQGITLSVAQARYGDQVSPAPPEVSPRVHLGDWLGDGFELVRESGPFDVVLAVESMTHMPDPTQALIRARRVLAPGGRFVACVWLSGDGVGPLRERWLLEPVCREGRLSGLPTADEFLSMMRTAGFVRGRLVADLSQRVRRTWSLTIRQAVGRLARDPEARRFLLDPGQPERVFAATMLRIWAAYRIGAMRYGLFLAAAPG
ncbi:MAG: methyltransferase domain-containing protein [Gemmatimonadota bacterium]